MVMPEYAARMVVDVKIEAQDDEEARSKLQSTSEWEDWQIQNVELLDVSRVREWPYSARVVKEALDGGASS